MPESNITGFVFDINTGHAFPDMKSCRMHGYGDSLRTISVEVYNALQKGEITKADLQVHFSAAARLGNKDASADILLKKDAADITNKDITESPPDDNPTHEDLAEEEAEKIAEAEKKAPDADPEGTVIPDGDADPVSDAMKAFRADGDSTAKLTYAQLVAVAQELGVDTTRIKKTERLKAAIAEKVAEAEARITKQ